MSRLICLLAFWVATWLSHCDAQEVMTVMVGDVKFEMIQVEGGSFLMGCEPELYHVGKNDEVPQHPVQLNSFFLGRYEVTQRLWNAVMGYNPSNFVGDDRPVEQVSYDEVLEFIRRLNEITDLSFRLPTEAEWEYAARGGKENRGFTYAGSNEPMNVGWCHLNSGDSTHAVGELVPNRLGIYDLTGNVWEWCQDWYQDDYYHWCKAIANGLPKTVTTSEGMAEWERLNQVYSQPVGTTSARSYPASQRTMATMDANHSTPYLGVFELEESSHKTVNPTGADEGYYRVGRGGSWADYENDLRVSYRNFWVPERKLSNLGFRLALNSDAPTIGWMPNQYIIDSIVDDKIYASTTTEKLQRLQEGILEGTFSVGPEKQIHFSKGNLQYNPQSHKWRFADNQYDYMGDANLKLAPGYAGWIDLFQWASSGYREHPPERYSLNSRSYGNGERSIDGTSYDWGVYNPITNGGNASGHWRTLSVYEWHYLLAMRPDASLLRLAAKVGDVQGLLLLPDDWLSRGFDTLRPTSAYSFTIDEWSRLERAGAVFMPAGGFCRMNTYELGKKVGSGNDVPIEGFNVPFGTLIPQHSEPLSAMARMAIVDPDNPQADMAPTQAEYLFVRKTEYRPDPAGDIDWGRYWTTVHYGDRRAMAITFSLDNDFYAIAEERVNRLAVRLVQDVTPSKARRRSRGRGGVSGE